jgi:hypothetical protein
VNTFCQFTIAIGVTTAIFAYKGMKGKELAILVSFVLMRILQPLFNWLESTAANSSKTASVIISLFFFLLFAGLQVGIWFAIGTFNYEMFLKEKMFILIGEVVFVLEIFIWDTIFLPIFMSVIAQSEKCRIWFTPLTI